jgi:hypothetical protein
MFLTDFEVEIAIALWGLGNDTFDIAKVLRVHESAIFNALREYREKRRKTA